MFCYALNWSLLCAMNVGMLHHGQFYLSVFFVQLYKLCCFCYSIRIILPKFELSTALVLVFQHCGIRAPHRPDCAKRVKHFERV